MAPVSSKRRIRRRSCGDKAKFDTVELAQAAAKRAKRRGHIVTAYRCDFGNHYHIGHVQHPRVRRTT